MGLIAMSERDLQRIEVLSKVVDGLVRHGRSVNLQRFDQNAALSLGV